MELNIRYRGITATTGHIISINNILKTQPQISRTRLSQELCRKWNWVQPNGALRDIVCRSFLLELEKAGHIKLPARKCVPNNPLVYRKRPSKVSIATRPLRERLKQVKPLIIHQVRRSDKEKLFNSLIEEYHYLGYTQPVGEHLKYLIYSKDRPIACFAFSSAPRHIGSRDRYIGWDQKIRKRNIHLMAYNTRFLILPWVRIPYLASHLLSILARRISGDWEAMYRHPVYYLETFVDTERFTGTCYKAANWVYLGLTTGRGKNDNTKKQNRSLKSVWGYPLVEDFREKMNYEHDQKRS